MTKRMLGLLALTLLAGSMSLAACGGSTQAPSGTEGETSTEPGSTGGEESSAAMGGPMDLGTTKTLDTFVFDPSAWETTAGAETTIALDNSTSTQEHSWVLLKEGVTRDDALTIMPDDTENTLFDLVAQPGQMASGSFTAPSAPGEYVVACTVAGHAAGGMVGTLTVK